MLVQFFLHLKSFRLPVSTREFLTLLEALDSRVVSTSLDDFYVLSRACLVKDEQLFDRFDVAFGTYFKGVDGIFDFGADVPDEWLRREFELHLSDEDKRAIEALGGLDKLLETSKKWLEEQKGRHQGGKKWIGTGGTSPFGNAGYNPEGIRIGGESKHRRAVKVWDRREFKDLDDQIELGTRNIKIALRRLRRFAREGAAEELDLDATIDATAREAMLDIRLRPERHNAIKVLLLLDIGGSMDDHVEVCEALFGAAKSEFKRLEYFYFHNFIYDALWRDHQMRMSERVAVTDVLRRYNADYKVIFVGDAAMATYEITDFGGAIDNFSGRGEPGSNSLRRFTTHFRKVAWLNPTPRAHWDYTQSNTLIREFVDGHMYPLTPDGLTQATRWLTR